VFNIINYISQITPQFPKNYHSSPKKLIQKKNIDTFDYYFTVCNGEIHVVRELIRFFYFSICKQHNVMLWDNTPLFVKYNPGLLDLVVLLDETGLQTGL
jgi:hypothetical protein